MIRMRPLAALASAVVLSACAEDKAAAPAAVGGGDPVVGQQVYLSQCLSCHGPDPARDGPLGPAVKGASRALLEARVLRGDYPSGYTPKRNTSVMQPLPNLAANIPDLAAYLR